MKKNLFFLFFILVNTKVVFSQIIAGNTSPGLIISNPSVNFSVTTMFTSGIREFDLNCDGIADMSVELYKGPTAIDGANMAYLHVLNSAFQVCADTVNMQPRHVSYFNLGDTIICPANTNWYNDANIHLGNYGCMDCPGPFSSTDLFLGYKNSNTSQTGWIKISFNLIDGGASVVPITLSVPEILSPCVTTSVSVTTTSTPTYTGSGVVTCGVFTYNYIITAPNCNNWCDGNIAISNISGGTPNYTYSWNTVPIQTSSTNYNVCSGRSIFTISDASGNSCVANFNVPNPSPITFSLSTTNVSCYGGVDGSICCIGLSGGVGPYTYEWFPTGGNGACVNNLIGGNYYFCVTDGNGCQVCSSALVSEPPPITFSLSTTHVSCYGGSDGTICCNGVSGGTGAYYYAWAPGGNVGACSTNNPAGSYTLCVTDANGCQTCSVAIVNQPPQLVISPISYTNVSCYLGNDGSLCGAASGGTTPYSYIWLPMAEVTPCTNNVAAGNYTFCVSDANGCQACSLAVVSQPTQIQVSESITQATCLSCCDGNVQLQIAGGTPAYAINYSPTSPACPGVYNYCITDTKGCTYCDSVLISYPTSIVDLVSENMFDVFPNPNKGNFEIKNLSLEISSIKITDVNGKIVFTKIYQPTNQPLLINSNVADGIYFLHITGTGSNKEFIKKIVVQK